MEETDFNSENGIGLESLSDNLILALGWECAQSWDLELAPALLEQFNWAKTTTTIGEVAV